MRSSLGRGLVVAALAGVVLPSCRAATSGPPASLIPAQPPPPRSAETALATSRNVVRGRALAHDGAPLAMAHAFVLGPDGKPIEERTVGPDGSFVLSLADVTDRVVRVQLTGVDHRVETLAVAPAEAPIELTVRLGTYRAPPSAERPTFMLFLDGGGMKPYAMTEQPDGTFVADLALPDGRYGYEIQGLSLEGHVVNGTAGEGYEYDGDGDYKSLFTVTGGKASVVFDPRKRPPAGRPTTVVFGAAARESEALTDIVRRVADAGATHDATSRSAAADLWEDVRRGLADLARAPGDAQRLARDAASVAYFAGVPSPKPTDQERELARRCLDRLKPTDPFWSFFPALANVVTALGDDARTDAYATAFVEGHPDTKAAAEYVLARLGGPIDAGRARGLYAALQGARFAGSPAQREAKLYDPDRPLAPGKDIGTFELKALAGDRVDPTRTYTSKSLAGKVFLLDVWATWCKPCVAELPRLHEIHARYGAAAGRKGLTILSVSLDAKPADVMKFRQDKEHPMPWLHAFVGRDDEPLRSVIGSGVPSIPLYVLVDERGKIVAASPQLRADSLPALLDRVLR
jgi:thiol-disulfide isomerase/thioredoxin